MCGGEIEFEQGATVGVCDSCGTKQTLPRLDDDRKANLYDRANHFRRNNDFDKAMGIYEQILNEDGTDAETYWSLVLCRYGIEYVEDPATHKRVPTVNRAQYTSIFDDDDYKSALKYADAYQRSIYEDEAKAINEIQKGILEISQKEEPFDVFICYKETDNSGRRTPDSVLANDLYHQLTQEGFKVFFSGITLEDKLGTAYEPYIFAALNSAKVMVVIGTKPEYFNAVWVKNEWSRYLALVKKSGGKKVLIPAYRDMDPYDLPEEFSHLLAQDMSKLGFMQDLIRGIKKIASVDEPKAAAKEAVVVNSGSSSVEPLLKRAFMFLEDREWEEADKYCEKVLDIDPENAQAYLGKLMAECEARRKEDLKDCRESFDDSSNFEKVVRFGDKQLVDELESYSDHIFERNENDRLTRIYRGAVINMKDANTEEKFKAAAKKFESIHGFMDADEKRRQCLEKAEESRKDAIYNAAIKDMERDARLKYGDAISKLESIRGWRDADKKIQECSDRLAEIERKREEQRIADEKADKERRIAAQKAAQKAAEKKKRILSIAIPVAIAVIALVIVLTKVIIPNSKYNAALELYDEGKYYEAAAAFLSLGDYKDSQARCFTAMEQTGWRQTVVSEYEFTAAVKNDGTVVAAGNNEHGQCDVSGWTDIVSIACSGWHTVGLKADGTVVATGVNWNGRCDVSDWRNIVAIACGGEHTVGLKSDGTVVATGVNDYGQCDVSDWRNIVAIACDSDITVGLKSDGTVVAAGYNKYGQCDVSGWTDIVAIACGGEHTVGLKSDGTVVATGVNDYGQCDVSDWRNIVAIACDSDITVGLKSDGTVVAAGYNKYGQCDVSGWTDIVAIACGGEHTVGLKSDGTVVATGYNHDGQCDVSGWTDIVAIACGREHTVGLKSDGTVVAAGYNKYGQCDVSSWTDIVSIGGVSYLTIGLKSDGTVVATGVNDYGQCDVSDWRNIVAIACDSDITVGLKSDGTVVAAGYNKYGQCDVSSWTNIRLPNSKK